MATLAQIDAKINLAVAAVEADDLAAAIRYCTSAQLLISATPDSQKGNERVAWADRADRLSAMIAQLRSQQTAGRGIQRQNVTYTDPDAVEDYS